MINRPVKTALIPGKSEGNSGKSKKEWEEEGEGDDDEHDNSPARRTPKPRRYKGRIRNLCKGKQGNLSGVSLNKVNHGSGPQKMKRNSARDGSGRVMISVLEEASNLPRKTDTLLRQAPADEAMRNRWHRTQAVVAHTPMPAWLIGCPAH